MYNIYEKIRDFVPFNEQEQNDKCEMLKLLEINDNIFSRDNKQYHMTASAWVVNKNKTKVIMAYHNIYDSWSWLGGHADGDENLLEVAIKEVKEESGIKLIKCLSEDIFSLEILTVDGHIKRGKYVPSHLHLNVSFLLEADENETLMNKPDENKDVKWFSLDEAIDASSEKWIKENIYKKLNDKLKLLK